MSSVAHRGYSLDRLVGSLYMSLEGIFGVPLDVAATYIVLFAIYGTVLQFSAAGSFFMNWSMAAMGRSSSGAGPGRTVALAGFLLGTVSGRGFATTVMLGSVSWSVLKRAGRFTCCEHGREASSFAVVLGVAAAIEAHHYIRVLRIL